MGPLLSKIRTGVIAGAIGAIVNSVAIEAVKASGLNPGTGGLAKLVFGHPLSRIGSEGFHFCMGVAMATTYVVIARKYLPGPGWLRGLIFVQIPGAIQLLWVLPATGHGLGGSKISPITPLLAWSLNALFGVVFGAIAGCKPLEQ